VTRERSGLNILKAIESELPAIDVASFSASDLDAVTAAAHPAQAFFTSSWFSATAQPFDIIGARRPNGTPVAAIPFTDRAIGPFRIKEIPGSYWPFRSFPVAEDLSDIELSALLRSEKLYQALGRVWRLGPVYSNDPTASRLASIAGTNGWYVIRKSLATCYELDLAALGASGPWPKGSTARKNRARERKLSADGEVGYRFLSGAELDKASIDAMAIVEANSWLATLNGGGDTKFLDPENRAIWEKLSADPALSQSLFASLMTVGEAPIAFSFGLEVGDCRYYIANNYDDSFSKFGVGKLLLYKDFEFAAGRGISKVSWGAGDAGYKTEMGAEPGPEIQDLLFVRGRTLAMLLRALFLRAR
jgi:CelD/BcsL family acetyltransferase involved in cellulose biosynthesis